MRCLYFSLITASCNQTATVGNKIGILYPYVNIGNLYRKLNKFEQSQHYLDLTIAEARLNDLHQLLALAYEFRSSLNEARSNPKQALEDYKKFKHLFEPGEVLYLTGRYQQRYNSDEFQLKLDEVRQLASIGEEKTESITVKIDIEKVNSAIGSHCQNGSSSSCDLSNLHVSNLGIFGFKNIGRLSNVVFTL